MRGSPEENGIERRARAVQLFGRNFAQARSAERFRRRRAFFAPRVVLTL
jgi:hypothetical protein